MKNLRRNIKRGTHFKPDRVRSLLNTSKQIRFTKKFKENLKLGISKSKKSDILFHEIELKIDLFRSQRSNYILRDHPLKDALKNYRSFSITNDIRIIYREIKDYFIFIDIGTHEEVY